MSYTLPAVPTIDQIQTEARAASFTKRSIKKDAKKQVLKLIISMIDLTTLEGMDTPGKVRMLCQKGKQPLVGVDLPQVGAICVYPSMVAVAAEALRGTGIHLASVATAFPSGQLSLDMRLAEVRQAVADGADEIDMVINRGAFLSGDYATVFDEIAAVKEACGEAHLKVIWRRVSCRRSTRFAKLRRLR